MADKTTTCVECKKKITYTTKKPKWCKVCKKKQPKVYHQKKRRIPKTSKKERSMQFILNELFPEVSFIDGGYYSFLRSPKGAPLQLDRYYPRLKMAFEYDGAQHKEYQPFVHKTKEAFDYQQQCDRIKDETCQRFEIMLIRIPHTDQMSKEYFIERFKELGIYDDLKKRGLND